MNCLTRAPVDLALALFVRLHPLPPACADDDELRRLLLLLTLDGLLSVTPCGGLEQSPMTNHRTVVSACTLYLVFKEPAISTRSAAGVSAAPRAPDSRLAARRLSTPAVFRGTFQGYASLHAVSSFFIPLHRQSHDSQQRISVPDRNCRGDDFDLSLAYRLASFTTTSVRPCSPRLGCVRRTF
jgi:hypothetical protein